MEMFANLARWIAEQPLSSGWIAIVVGSTAIGGLGSLMTTLLIGPEERDIAVTGIKLSVLGQVFSGLLAFVLIHGALLQYDLRTLLDQEGRLMTNLNVTAQRTAPETLGRSVQHYVSSVVTREIPAIARGRTDPVTQGAFDDMLLAFVEAPQALPSDTGSTLGKLVEVRAKRIVRSI